MAWKSQYANELGLRAVYVHFQDQRMQERQLADRILLQTLVTVATAV